MDKKQIEKLTPKQLDDELFREVACSWEKKDLVSHLVENLTHKEKMDWVKQWFEIED